MNVSQIETIKETAESKAALESLLSKQTDEQQLKGKNSNLLHVVGLHDFIQMELPVRETIMSPWLKAQSLNLLYGWRGVGKTHTNLGISYAVACGNEFLQWKADKPRRVLLVDGEMPAPALQERFATIITSTGVEPEPGFLSIVTPDLQTGAMPDLSTYDGQEIISEAVARSNAELIIIDNLSCLVRGGGRENDAESWVKVQEWALLQRKAGRSVLFIHHSGKNGQQRGTSKREDLLDVVISLRRPPDYDPASGACFAVHYEKARHLFGTDVNPFEAQLTVAPDGTSTWTCRSVTESTFDRVISLANEGLSQGEIANELDLHKSTVCKAWRKADAEGRLETKATGKGSNQYKKASKGE